MTMNDPREGGGGKDMGSEIDICQEHNSRYPCLLCDHIKGINTIRSENEALKIAHGEDCKDVIGWKKRCEELEKQLEIASGALGSIADDCSIPVTGMCATCSLEPTHRIAKEALAAME